MKTNMQKFAAFLVLMGLPSCMVCAEPLLAGHPVFHWTNLLFFVSALAAAVLMAYCLVSWGRYNAIQTGNHLKELKDDVRCSVCGIRFARQNRKRYCTVCGHELLQIAPSAQVYDARSSVCTGLGIASLLSLGAAFLLHLNNGTALYRLPHEAPASVLLFLVAASPIVFIAARSADFAKTPGLTKKLTREEALAARELQQRWKENRGIMLRGLALGADPETFIDALEKLYGSSQKEKVELFLEVPRERPGREKCAELLYSELAAKKDIALYGLMLGAELSEKMTRKILSNLTKPDDITKILETSSSETVRNAARERIKKLEEEKSSREKKAATKREARQSAQSGDIRSDKAGSATRDSVRQKIQQIKALRITAGSSRQQIEDKINKIVYLSFDLRSLFSESVAADLNQSAEDLRSFMDSMPAERLSEYADELMDKILKYL